MILNGKSAVFGALLALGMTGTAFAQGTTQGTSQTAVSAADSAAPGPYAGWPVLSKEGIPVGRVTYSPEAVDGKLPFIVVYGEDGSSFRVTNGVEMIGPDSIVLTLSKAVIDSSASGNFRNIVVQ